MKREKSHLQVERVIRLARAAYGAGDAVDCARPRKIYNVTVPTNRSTVGDLNVHASGQAILPKSCKGGGTAAGCQTAKGWAGAVSSGVKARGKLT